MKPAAVTYKHLNFITIKEKYTAPLVAAKNKQKTTKKLIIQVMPTNIPIGLVRFFGFVSFGSGRPSGRAGLTYWKTLAFTPIVTVI